MIVRDYENGWLLITQPSHAWGCGRLVRLWGNEQFARPGARRELMQATNLHDIGWAEWDSAPPLNADGTPRSFMQTTLEETDAIWQRAVTTLRQFNPYAALLVSMHAATIYTRRLERDADPPEARAAVEGMLQEQQQIQRDLQNYLSGFDLYDEALNSEQLEANYRVLRTCDLLSLACCTGPLTAGEIANVPGGNASERVTITYTPVNDTTLTLSPYPFRDSETVLSVEGRYLPQKRFDSVKAYQAALNAAEMRMLAFKFMPASE